MTKYIRWTKLSKQIKRDAISELPDDMADIAVKNNIGEYVTKEQYEQHKKAKPKTMLSLFF